jgi:hypothetical protein
MTTQPSDLNIERANKSKLTVWHLCLAVFGIGFFFFGVVLLSIVGSFTERFDRAELLVTNATRIVEKLPESIDRTQKLLDRTDETVKRGVAELKSAIPEVSKGLVDSFKNKNKPEELGK